MKRTQKNPTSQSAAERARTLLLGMLSALIVASVLLPADSIAAPDGAGLPLVALTLLLAVAFCGLAVAGRVSAHRFGLVEWAVVTLIVFHALAAIASLHYGARPAINMVWQWTGLGVGFLLARQLVRTAVECRAIVAIMLTLCVLQAVYAGWQVGVELPRDRQEFSEAKIRDPNIPLPGLGFASATVREELLARFNNSEPTASFAMTNSLAGFLAAWLVVGTGVAAGAVRSERLRARVVGPLAIGLLAAAACLYQTHSRTAQLAAAVGLVLLLATGGGVRLRRYGGWLIGGLALLLAAALTLVLTTHGPSLAGPRLSVVVRLEYWQATWRLFLDHWLLGCGPGHFRDLYTQHMQPHYRESISDPHNFLLEMLSTAGIPATVALVVALAGFFLRVAKRDTESQMVAESDRVPGPDRVPGANDRVPGASGGLPQEGWGGAPLAPGTHAGTFAIILGAALGMALAYLLAKYFNPVIKTLYDPEAIIVGLVLSAAFVWCLWPWVCRGRLPAKLLAIGAAVLLLNLLGAGGISYPGVAGSLWLLVALGLTQAESNSVKLPVSRGAAGVAFLVAMALAAACQWTALSPVVRSRMALDMALEAYRLAATSQDSSAQKKEYLATGQHWLNEAVQADPWDALAQRESAQRRQLAWLESQSEDREDAFESAHENWLKLAHASADAHKLSGDWFLLAYRKFENPELAQRAANAYLEAVNRFPASSLLRAQLAWAEHLAGEDEQAARNAAEALRLDRLNPYEDRKLNYKYVRLSGDPQVKDKSPAELMQQLISAKN
ncbi:MAG: O-antigen ligase family protein [Planctomycetes bacterium]|nr:O-antigen ligase family protein [Planctomycetota bacterium]